MPAAALVAVALLLALVPGARAAAPANDAFASATVLPAGTGSVSGTLADATREPGEPGAGGGTVWYEVRRPTTQAVEVEGCADEIINSRRRSLVLGPFGGPSLAVYTGPSVGSLTPVETTAAPCPGGGDDQLFVAQAQSRYWVQVAGFGDVSLRVDPKPRGDDRDAYVFPHGPGEEDVALTTTATAEAGEAAHAGQPAAHSVWYRLGGVAAPTPTSLDTCDATFDTVLEVLTEAGSALTSVAASDDDAACGPGSQQSRVSFVQLPGRDYRIVVDGKAGAAGILHLHRAAASDAFAAPIALDEDVRAEATTFGATAEAGEPAHGGTPARHSTWFSFTPARSATLVAGTCDDTAFDSTVGLYTGTSVGALTSVAQGDEGCPSGHGTLLRARVQAGTSYRLAVDTKTREGRFGLTVATNDDRADAAPLALGAPLGLDTRPATGEAGEVQPAGVVSGHSLWYRVVAPRTGKLVVDTCAASGFDTVLSVYGPGAGQAELAASDDSPTCSGDEHASRLSFPATAGSAYLVRLAGKGTDAGTATLEVIANDDREDALPLTADTPVSALTWGATKQAGEPDHAGGAGGHSVWYSVTPTRTRLTAVEACERAGPSPVLGVYTLDGGALRDAAVERAGATQSCFGGARVTFAGAAGTTYYVAVDDADGTGGAAQVTFAPSAVNDTLAHAQPLYGSGSVEGTTVDAHTEPGRPAHGSGSVWYRYTAPTSGTLQVGTCTATTLDTVLDVYRGAPDATDPASLTPLSTADDTADCGDGHQGLAAVALNAGETAYVTVDAAAAGAFTLHVTGTDDNDAFANARGLTDAAIAYGFTGDATREPGESGGARGVWFSVTRPAGGLVQLSTCQGTQSSYDTTLAVFTGADVAHLTPVVANDDDADGCPGTQGSSVRLQAEPGVAYRVRVAGKGTDAGSFGLVTSYDVPNDAFAAAQAFDGNEVAGSTVGATAEPGEPAHAGRPAAHSVWYRLPVGQGGVQRVQVCPTSFGGDGERVAVYRGSSLATLQLVGQATVPGYTCATARAAATTGDVLYVAVDSVGATGRFRLSSYRADPPANDLRANAEVVDRPSTPIVSTEGAGHEPGEPDHAGAGTQASVWYRYTPVRDGVLLVSTCGADSGFASFDTVLAVYRGDTAIASSDDDPTCSGGASRVRVAVQAGVAYDVALDGHAGADGYAYVAFRTSPANDTFADAQPVSDAATEATTALATAEPGEPAHGGSPAAHSVWFRVTAHDDAPLSIDACSDGATQPRVAVYTGTGVTALTLVGETDGAGCATGGGRVSFPATDGTVYKVAVDGAEQAVRLRVTPAHDTFANAKEIPDADGYRDAGDLEGTTGEAGEPADGLVAPLRTLWYRYTPQRDADLTLETCGSPGTQVRLFTGTTVGALTPVDTETAAACPDGTGTRVRARVVQSRTYRIAVGATAVPARSRPFTLATRVSPPNDDLAFASLVTGQGTTAGTTADATHEAGEPDHAGAGGTASVWYQLRPGRHTGTRVQACRGVGATPAVAVSTIASGGLAGLTPVATTGPSACDRRFVADPTMTYYVAVDDAAATAGPFALAVGLGPANDELADAAPLGTRAATVAADARLASVQAGEPGGGAASVWYVLTPDASGPLTVRTCGASYDTLVGVYTGTTLATLSPVVTGTCRVTFTAAAGTTYRLRVAAASDGGDLVVGVGGPANDDRGDAIVIPGDTASVVGSNAGATREAGQPLTGSATVWWAWTAPRTQTAMVNTCGSGYDTLLAVTRADDTVVAGYDDDGGECGNGSRVTFAATAGTTYRFAVDGYNGQTGSIRLQLNPPANDRIAGATALTGATPTADGTIVAAAAQGDEGPAPGIGRTVWFRWTPPADGDVVIDACTAATPLALRVVGDLGRGTIAPLPRTRPGVPPGCDGTVGDRRAYALDGGQTYLIEVDGTGPGVGPFSLALTSGLDTDPPETTITDGPAALSAVTDATLRFTASQTGSTFACALDGAPSAPCGSPVTYPGLAEGGHTFTVVATDRSGNVDPTPASRTFTLDRTAPDTTLTGGPTGPVHEQPIGWTVTSSEGTGRVECALDGGSYGDCGAAIQAANTASPGAHTFRARAVDGAGNLDPTPATDDYEVVDVAPTAALDVTPATGPAPLDTSARVTGTDADGDALGATVDFGDGTGAAAGPPPLTQTHRYSRPGTYLVRATVRDRHATTVATQTVQVAAAEPVHADAGEDLVATAGKALRFDASRSRPAATIERYRWSFGDGTTADGDKPTHTYARAGDYVVRLTVSGGGESDDDQLDVHVEPGDAAGLAVTLKTTAGALLRDANVATTTRDGQRVQALSGPDGVAHLDGLPDGTYAVSAYADGYLPVTEEAKVTGKTGALTLTLAPGDVARASVDHRELSRDEIVAAGIDPNAPDNATVVSYEVHLVFRDPAQPAAPPRPVTFTGYYNGGGFPVGGGGCGAGCVDPGGAGTTYTTPVVGPDGKLKAIAALVLPLQSGWLKQFFEVSFTIEDLAGSGFSFQHGSATMNLPSGLSLAPTSRDQTLTQPVPDVPGGGSQTVSWIVRGDDPGSYAFGVDYTSSLEPVGATVRASAVMRTPIVVYGGQAVDLVTQAEDVARRGSPYHVRLGLHNTSPVTVHNVTVRTGTGGDFVDQPRQQRTFSQADIAPGETVWLPSSIYVPLKDGDLDIPASFTRVLAEGSSVDRRDIQRLTVTDPVQALSGSSEVSAVKLSWAPVPGATDYEVYRADRLEDGFPDVLLVDVRTRTSALITDVDPAEPAKVYAVSAVIGDRNVLTFGVVTVASHEKEPPPPPPDPNGGGGGGGSGGGGDGSGDGGVGGNAPAGSGPIDDDGAGAPDGEPGCTTIKLKKGIIDAEAACFTVKAGVWTSTKRVRLNGIDISPDKDGSFSIDTNDASVYSRGAVSVQIGSQVIFHGPLRWNISPEKAIALSSDGGSKVAGLPIFGVAFGFTDGGASLTIHARLPSVFSGVSIGVTGSMSQEHGLHLDGASIKLPDVKLGGKVELKDTSLTWNRTPDGHNLLVGESTLKLPSAPPREPKVKALLEIADGDFHKLSVDVSGLNVPIGELVFLQSAGLTVEVDPGLTVEGRLAMTLGPEIKGLSALKADATASISFGGESGQPWQYSMTGGLKVVGFDVADAKLTLSPAGAEAEGNVDLTLGPYGFEGGVKGYVRGGEFELGGDGKLSVPGPDLSGKGLISQNGMAACGKALFVSGGWGYRWGDKLPHPFTGCDIGSYGAGARAAQVGVPSVAVPKGQRGIVYAFHGVDTPPLVALAGPGGVTVSTPPTDDGSRDARSWIVKDTDSSTTYVLLFKPAAGRWAVTTLPGSSRIASVQTAPVLAPVRVAGRTTAKRDGRRTLSWSLTRVPGQVVRFVERDGGYARVLRTTTAAAGSVTWRPDPGTRARRIEAVVEQDGLTRQVVALGRFALPKPARLGRPGKLKITHRGSLASVRWAPVRGAQGYEVRLTDASGQSVITTVTRPRAVLTAYGDVTVRVAAQAPGARPSLARVGRG